MTSSWKRPGSITFLLVGIILLVFGVIFYFLPLVECPLCHGATASDFAVDPGQGPTRITVELCAVCVRGKASLVKAWQIRRVLEDRTR